jgi:Zn-dependent protease
LGSQAVEHAFGINVHYEVPAFIGLVFERAPHSCYTGQIDSTIKFAVVLHYLLDPFRHFFVITHVKMEASSIVGQGLEGFRKIFFVSIRN